MKKSFSLVILIVTASVIQFLGSGCAYKLSSQTATLPGNVKVIQIPLFINDSNEVGAETYFTNSLKTEAIRSKVVQVKNDDTNVEAILQGRIRDITVIADESVIEARNTLYLPTENVLATQYRVTATVVLELKRKNSTDVLYSGQFVQTMNYSAPQITLPVINTANSLYNESAKRQTLDTISKELMQAAFDRMVENF
jgi:hypothetical protein